MYVAAMESQDLLLEAIDAIFTRVQHAVARGFLGILGLGVCMNLIRLRRRLGKMGRIITAKDVHTDADRRRLRKIAQFHQHIADSMSNARNLLADMKTRPLLQSRMMRLFDNVVVQAEDVAETAALGASMEFANLVKEDLKGRSTAKAGG